MGDLLRSKSFPGTQDISSKTRTAADTPGQWWEAKAGRVVSPSTKGLTLKLGAEWRNQPGRPGPNEKQSHKSPPQGAGLNACWDLEAPGLQSRNSQGTRKSTGWGRPDLRVICGLLLSRSTPLVSPL